MTIGKAGGMLQFPSLLSKVKQVIISISHVNFFLIQVSISNAQNPFQPFFNILSVPLLFYSRITLPISIETVFHPVN